ncbi:hypothetical protein ACQX5R_16415 [Salmonella enterica]|uniref:hypothetical protein n=1 Tax=Salmonella enterica TaxID=28901 RepID=UPI000DD101E9|nr:hypothetical protein DPF89_02770 [Salmonella enterica subsp. enterica serovar Napoli]
MTTITSKFTKERLIDWAVVAVAERGRDLKDAPESVEAAANLKLAEIALAALTAEPVRYLNKFSGTCVTLEQQSNAADDVAVYIPLYAAPPAPVVPEEITADGIIGMHECGFVEGWNACSAAMLQAGNHTEQHLDMVDHSGDANEKGCDGTFIDEGTKQAGNSPVIGIDMASEPDRSVEVRYLAPPGYVMVPKVVTPEIGNAINEIGQRCTCGNCSQRLWDMLLAAAQKPETGPCTK